jgi:hypothetical protein
MLRGNFNFPYAIYHCTAQSTNRKKFGVLKQDATLQLFPVDERSSLPATPMAETPTPAMRKRPASYPGDTTKTKKAKMTSKPENDAAEQVLRVKGGEGYGVPKKDTAEGKSCRTLPYF